MIHNIGSKEIAAAVAALTEKCIECSNKNVGFSVEYSGSSHNIQVGAFDFHTSEYIDYVLATDTGNSVYDGRGIVKIELDDTERARRLIKEVYAALAEYAQLTHCGNCGGYIGLDESTEYRYAGDPYCGPVCLSRSAESDYEMRGDYQRDFQMEAE